MERINKTLKKSVQEFKLDPFRVTHNERYETCQAWRKADEN